MSVSSSTRPVKSPVETVAFHKGTKFYHHSYVDFRAEQTVPAIEITVQAMYDRAEPNLLILFDARGAQFDTKTLAALKRSTPKTRHLIDKIAVIGIHPIQIAFVNFITKVFNMNIRVFDDLEKAKDWLVARSSP